MKDKFPEPKQFEEELGIEPMEIELEDCSIEHKGKHDVLDDFKTVRENMFKSIVRSSEVLDEAVRMVKACPMPKQIEAASTVIKALAENAEKLLDIHEKIQKIEAAHQEEINKEEKPKFVANLRDITKELQNKKVENG